MFNIFYILHCFACAIIQIITITVNNMDTSKQDQKHKTMFIILGIVLLLILVGMVIGIVVLSSNNQIDVEKVRDIFIIILAFESLLIGGTLIILIIQLALLSNMIQNEIKPILTSTKDTVNTVKGTSKFISEKAISPIISVAGLLAGGKKLFELVGFIREKKKE